MTTAAPPEAAAPPAGHAVPSGRRLTVNYLFLTGGEALAKVFMVAAFVYLGRELGPQRYGSLEFVIATMIFFTLPVDFGLGVYGAREVARDPRRAADLLPEVSTLRLTLASISFALLLVLAALLPQGNEVKFLLILYGLSLFAEPMLVQWFFQGHERMHWVALADLIRKGSFATFVLLLIRPSTPLAWVGVCECAAAVAVAMFCLGILRWKLGYRVPRPWHRLNTLKGHIRNSAPIGLSHLAWALQWYFATVLMGWLVAGDELGWFGVSHRVVMALHTFVYLYFYNLLPSLARGGYEGRPTERLRELLARSLGLTLWGGTLAALALTLVGGDVVTLAYGPGFLGVHGPLAVLGWVIPVALLGGHYRYLLIACNQQQLEMRCSVAAAVSAVVLGFVLIPLYGAIGAAAALLMANVVSLVLAYMLVNYRIAAIPCLGQLTLPLLAVGVALACWVGLANLGPWLAAGAAGSVYGASFVAWAGWQYYHGGLELRAVDSAVSSIY